ncbi:MAG: flagellar hook-basal body complex protein FliE [Candidatus Brocadiae bacterium]|nr:flagellar hook-basal body complex protein FliE [Candidatus Brocadiia bacterium]
MDSIASNFLYHQITSAYTKANQPNKAQEASLSKKTEAPSMGQMIGKMVQEVDSMQKKADTTVQEFALGKKDILDVSMSINKADIGLKLAVEVRNKALEAYQEIMKTTI